MLWKCGNVRSAVHRHYRHSGECSSSFVISKPLCTINPIGGLLRPLAQHSQRYPRQSSLCSAVFILSFWLLSDVPLHICWQSSLVGSMSKSHFIWERGQQQTNSDERKNKEAHSSPSKDLTAALKEVCLLFSSFSVDRAWKRGKMKAKRSMNARQAPLLLFTLVRNIPSQLWSLLLFLSFCLHWQVDLDMYTQPSHERSLAYSKNNVFMS